MALTRAAAPLKNIFDVQAAEDKEPLAELAMERAHLAGLLQPPPNLSPAEAEAWAQQRLASLSADAVVELEFALRRGDTPRARFEAAKDVLDRAGFARSNEARSAGTAPVLILVGDSIKNLPWAQRAVEAMPAMVEQARKDESDK